MWQVVTGEVEFMEILEFDRYDDLLPFSKTLAKTSPPIGFVCPGRTNAPDNPVYRFGLVNSESVVPLGTRPSLDAARIGMTALAKSIPS